MFRFTSEFDSNLASVAALCERRECDLPREMAATAFPYKTWREFGHGLVRRGYKHVLACATPRVGVRAGQKLPRPDRNRSLWAWPNWLEEKPEKD